MSDLETVKKELIETILCDYAYYRNVECLYNACSVDSYDEYLQFMNSKTFDELARFINTKLCMDMFFCKTSTALRNLLIDRVKYAKKELQINKTNKEITNIKDYMQNTTDVVNLFTDIDKNRINLEEQNKQINNRLDKLEASLNQLINLLQKS